jgi:hypothetical protein
MPTRREQIHQKAIEILKANPDGVRYSQLVKHIKEAFPNFPINTILGEATSLDSKMPTEVYKAGRGLYRHLSFREAQQVAEEVTTAETAEISERDFYEPFVDYLVNELEECTKAIDLGGNAFRDKWGTPDVIGVEKSKRSDIIHHEDVIVSAEIKTDTTGLITAFGQACAYKSFSNKVYIVIPKTSSEDDKSRIESLCLIFGIGLILFDSQNKENPDWEIRVRALKHEPDMFYVNKYMKTDRIERELFS